MRAVQVGCPLLGSHAASKDPRPQAAATASRAPDLSSDSPSPWSERALFNGSLSCFGPEKRNSNEYSGFPGNTICQPPRTSDGSVHWVRPLRTVSAEMLVPPRSETQDFLVAEALTSLRCVTRGPFPTLPLPQSPLASQFREGPYSFSACHNSPDPTREHKTSLPSPFSSSRCKRSCPCPHIFLHRVLFKHPLWAGLSAREAGVCLEGPFWEGRQTARSGGKAGPGGVTDAE